MNSKPVVEFRAESSTDDTFSIRIYKDTTPVGWVNFVDLPAKRVCTVSLNIGWHGSKTQAERGAEQLAGFYADGSIL